MIVEVGEEDVGVSQHQVHPVVLWVEDSTSLLLLFLLSCWSLGAGNIFILGKSSVGIEFHNPAGLDPLSSIEDMRTGEHCLTLAPIPGVLLTLKLAVHNNFALKNHTQQAV